MPPWELNIDKHALAIKIKLVELTQLKSCIDTITQDWELLSYPIYFGFIGDTESLELGIFTVS